MKIRLIINVDAKLISNMMRREKSYSIMFLTLTLFFSVTVFAIDNISVNYQFAQDPGVDLGCLVEELMIEEYFLLEILD